LESAVFRRLALRVAALAVIALGQVGCQHIGPKTIVADRVPYNEALATSWKEQTLLNIVKMRYADTPFFVDVAAITSGYAKSNSASANFSYAQAISPEMTFRERIGALFGYQTAFEDRPTISYAPQTGAEFIRHLSAPIAPKNLLYLIQSGYDAEMVVELLVDSINGINNSIVRSDRRQDADPRFRTFLKFLKNAQLSGNLGMRVEEDKNKSEVVVIFFRDKNISPEQLAELNDVRKLFGLKADQSEFKVVFGATPKTDTEIAIMSRSLLRSFNVLSLSVEVPECHLLDGRAPAIELEARPSAGFADGNVHLDTPAASPATRLVVHSAPKKPSDCFAAIEYRGYWFWVDDRDPVSKRYFQFLMGILAQADTSVREPLPLVTIRAN
jgi:hypothetical protein